MNDPRNPTPEPVALTRQEDGLLTFPIEPPAYLSVEAFRAEFRKNLAVAPSGDQPPPA